MPLSNAEEERHLRRSLKFDVDRSAVGCYPIQPDVSSRKPDLHSSPKGMDGSMGEEWNMDSPEDVRIFKPWKDAAMKHRVADNVADVARTVRTPLFPPILLRTKIELSTDEISWPVGELKELCLIENSKERDEEEIDQTRDCGEDVCYHEGLSTESTTVMASGDSDFQSLRVDCDETSISTPTENRADVSSPVCVIEQFEVPPTNVEKSCMPAVAVENAISDDQEEKNSPHSANVASHLYEGAKGIWAWSKSHIPLANLFMGLTEAVASTVTQVAMGGDLQDTDKNIIQPHLSHLDEGVLNPVIRALLGIAFSGQEDRDCKANRQEQNLLHNLIAPFLHIISGRRLVKSEMQETTPRDTSVVVTMTALS